MGRLYAYRYTVTTRMMSAGEGQSHKTVSTDHNWNFFQVGYPVDTPTDIKSNQAKSNAAEGRLPCLVAVLTLMSLPDLRPLALE